MVRLVRADLFVILALLALGISCTIVEDSDVKSLSDLDKLELSSIEVVENTQQSGTKVIKLVPTINSSGKLQQVLFPSLTGKKFKFRSSSISGSATGFVSYNSSGKVITFDIQAGGQSQEKYSFEYNSSGNLFTVTSTGSFPGDVAETKDSILYVSGGIDKIYRTTTLSSGGKSLVSVTSTAKSSFNNATIRFGQFEESNGDCPNNTKSSACTGYFDFSTGGGGSFSITIRHLFTGARISTFMVGENTDGSKTPDVYAFHPVMLLRSEIPHSDDLMIYYMRDWWIDKHKNDGGGGGGTQIRESVAINFLYGNK